MSVVNVTELQVIRAGGGQEQQTPETQPAATPITAVSTSDELHPAPTAVVVRSDSTPAVAPVASGGGKGTVPHPMEKRAGSSGKSQAQLSHERMETGRSDYLGYQSRLKALWRDNIELTISYRDLAYVIPVPVKDAGIPNLAKSLLNFFLLKGFRQRYRDFLALQPNSGVVLPGQMTLVLAPPGHGKSTYLKALAGRYHGDRRQRGDVLYNGLSYDAALQRGLHVSKLTAFVDQGDIHMALLTVRETFQFALDNSVADPALLQDPAFVELNSRKVDFMIELLGLKEAENTILGNAMIRGVSGGQRRRVTIGEMMITNARALFLDEITTGLDSAASFDILRSLKLWCGLMQGSAVVALLQPTPECFELFDRLVLMRHGAVLYDGPVTEVQDYLTAIGVPVPDDQDLADFLSDFLTDPRMVYYRTVYRAARKVSRVNPRPSATAELKEDEDAKAEEEIARKDVSADNPAALTDKDADGAGLSGNSLGDDFARQSLKLVERTTAPLTTSSLQSAFLSSAYAANVQALQQKLASTGTEPPHMAQLSPYTQAQFGAPVSHPFFHSLRINLGRSAANMKRNGGFWGPRVFQAVFLGFILGGLFYQLSSSDFQARLGLCLFAATFMAFGNAAEIPFAAEGKDVVFKQQDAGFYSSASYVWSVIIVHIPLSIVESIIFSLIVYFMAGFDSEAGRYFFFLLVLWLTNIALSCVFRAITYATRHQDIANQMSGPVVATMFLVCGYLILYNNIPHWLIWAFWISPFTWILRSLAINEFYAPRYSSAFEQSDSEYDGLPTGIAYLRLWDIDPTWAYKWSGVGYLIGFFFVMMFLGSFLLARIRYPLTVGTRRFADEEEQEDKSEEQTQIQQQRGGEPQQAPIAVTLDRAVLTAQKYASSFKMQTASTALPFTPVDLAWRNIHYTVMVEKDKKQVPRKLLTGISGYAKAGQLTALMGSSGAGKTTLMDVIAGRKTAGTIEGEILVNGYPKVTATFNRMCGYVEQTDCHTGSQTVREALVFSASLRLPREVTTAQRDAFVTEVLDILELTPIADRIIGDSTMPGLSPGQLKRVTIGVELVSNPPVLFLDEPTSGLDSRAALIVMRVVKRISTTGRSVLCTIHQPSAELFCMFDRLLLLKTGGTTVYFGDLGQDGAELVGYFENAPLTGSQQRPKKAKKTNPASWMLDVIGAGTGAGRDETVEVADYNAIYQSSKLRSVNEAELDRLCRPKDGVPELRFDHVYAARYWTQFWEVNARTFQFYWRNPGFVWVRQGLMLFLSCLLGFLYLQVGVSTPQDAISKMSSVFVGIAFAGWTVMTSIIPVLLRNRVVYYREQSSYMYTPYAYAFAISFVEVFYTAFSTIVFLCCFYPMVGFTLTGGAFFRYFLVQYLVMLVWLSLGQLCACALPNILVANILSSLVGTFSLLFSGLFLVASQMPIGWKWIYYMDWVPKALIPIASVQFQCSSDCTIYSTVTEPDGSQQTNQSSQDYIWGYLDFNSYSYWPWIGWQLLELLVFRIFIVMAIAKVNYMKR